MSAKEVRFSVDARDRMLRGIDTLAHAVQGAASVAGLLITTEAMVAELPGKNGTVPGTPAGGGMGF